MSIYTTAEASRITGLSVKSLGRLIRIGELHAIKGGKGSGRGGTYLIDSAELERFKNEYMSKDLRRQPRMTKKKQKNDPHPLYDRAGIIRQILEFNNLTPLDYVKMSVTGGWSYNLRIIKGEVPVPRDFTKKFSELFDIGPKELDILIATEQYMEVHRKRDIKVDRMGDVAIKTFEEVPQPQEEWKAPDVPEEESSMVFNGQTGEKLGRISTSFTLDQDIYYVTLQSRGTDDPEWSEPHLLQEVVTFRFKKHAIEYLLNELPDSDPGYSYMKNPTKRQVSEDNNYILYTMVNESTLKATQVKFNINRAEVR